MKIFLKIENPKFKVEIPMESFTSIVVGRSSHSSCQVVDELMSGTHCKLKLDADKLEIFDLDSKNGTYLNGIRIDHAEFFLGDELRVGATHISLEAEKLDSQTIINLTFPGGQKARASHNLQLDFTGARTMNQRMEQLKEQQKNSPPPINIIQTSTVDKEVEIRRIAQSKIKLSKQQIKIKFSKNSSLCSIIDILVMIGALALPLFAFNLVFLSKIEMIQNNRLVVLLVTEIIFFLFVYIMNFKIMKFTLGEKFSGIEAKYLNQ